MKYNIRYFSQVIKQSHKSIFIIPSVALFLVACGGGGGTQVPSSFQLPLDYDLRLWCPNVGIADEQCVLFDPDNPYARSAIAEPNPDNPPDTGTVTKWDLNLILNNTEIAVSDKPRFYLWATALAKVPMGENQFYTAEALHRLFTQGGSENARTQAQKAYRSVLDNYFDDTTVPDKNQPEVTQLLRHWVGLRLYTPGSANLTQLFGSQDAALAAINSWGYSLDRNTGEISKQ